MLKIREEEYTSVVLTDVLEVVIIELPKYMKYARKERRENLNLWLEFLKNPEVKIMANVNDENNIKETKQAIKKAQDKLEEISKDEHERYLAELREKYIMDQKAIQEYGYLKGVEEGIEQGIEKEKTEIAKKLIKEGMNIDVISKITGLDKEKIKKLNK